ncbi:MAG: tetratricopeptide repeat protein [Desulfobacterales bacterium]|nr:tetratricopeptide repeat protein [Desulfobacterales bacterium]
MAREIRVSLFLIMITLAVYYKVGTFDFISFDDPEYVTQNNRIKSNLSWENIKWTFTSKTGANWHPLTLISHMIDWQLYGKNAGGHHLTNLIFHIANALLLFFALNKMTGKIWEAAFVAFLFSLHPTHVESVAWISERKDVLSTFFFMLTLLSYIRYIKKPLLSSYFIVLLFFSLGLMAKPMLVTLPFVLLLLDYWPLNRFSKKGATLNLILEKIPLFIVTIIVSIITFIVQHTIGATALSSVYSIKIRIANAIVAYSIYIFKAFFPYSLSVFYPYPDPPMRQTFLLTISILIIITISYAAIRTSKKFPYFITGWLFYLGTLVPVIGIIQVGSQSMADRYTYIPFIGIFIIVAWGLSQFTYKKIIFSIIIIVFSILTWRQVSYWENSQTLFKHSVDVDEKNIMAYNNLSAALIKDKKIDEAIEYLNKAIKIKPKNIDTNVNLCLALGKQNKSSEAIIYCYRAMKMKNIPKETHNSIGNALEQLGHVNEAIKEYYKALKLNPDYAGVINNLGSIFAKQGDINRAMTYFKDTIKIDPNFVEAYNNIGNILCQENKIPEAIIYYNKALEIDNDYADAHYNLGNIFRDKGDYNKAIIHFKDAIRIKPEHNEAHNNLGIILAQQGYIKDAIYHFKEAIKIKPEFKDAYNNLNLATGMLTK